MQFWESAQPRAHPPRPMPNLHRWPNFALHSSSLHIAHWTLHHSAHIAHYTTAATLECTHPGLVQCSMYTKYSTAFPQLLSTLHCRALVWSGILIKALRPFSNRKLNSPPPSQLNKKTRNTKRLKTAKVLLNCRMGNLFCRLHNIESPTSNKGGQRTLNIAWCRTPAVPHLQKSKKRDHLALLVPIFSVTEFWKISSICQNLFYSTIMILELNFIFYYILKECLVGFRWSSPQTHN